MSSKKKTAPDGAVTQSVKPPSEIKQESIEAAQQILLASWDYSDKPYDSRALKGAMTMFGYKAGIMKWLTPEGKYSRLDILNFHPTVQQAHEYLMRKASLPQSPEKPTTAPKKADTVATPYDVRFAEKFEEYASSYDLRKPNHRDTATQIVNMRLRLEDLQKILTFQPIDSDESFYLPHRKDYTDEENKLQNAVRQLEESLGVTKTQMDKTRQESNAVDMIASYVERTREAMKDQVVEFSHCGVILGYFIFHFKQTRALDLYTTCPRCTQEIKLSYSGKK